MAMFKVESRFLYGYGAGKRDPVARVKNAYETFSTFFEGCRDEVEQRETIFNYVYTERHIESSEWGANKKHYFYNRQIEKVGPFESREDAFAGFLLYMESTKRGGNSG